LKGIALREAITRRSQNTQHKDFGLGFCEGLQAFARLGGDSSRMPRLLSLVTRDGYHKVISFFLMMSAFGVAIVQHA